MGTPNNWAWESLARLQDRANSAVDHGIDWLADRAPGTYNIMAWVSVAVWKILTPLWDAVNIIWGTLMKKK
jgi:hypothetical protein